MPIVNQASDLTTARFETAILNGQQVHFAIDPNPNASASYRDEQGQPINHDRAFVTEMPNLSNLALQRIETAAMAAGIEAVREPPGYHSNQQLPITKPARSEMAHAGNKKGKEKGATAGTLMLYDPKGFTLRIASKGDSPAFVILDDGKKIKAIKVSSGEDTDPQHPNDLDNSMNDPLLPVRQASYQIPGFAAHSGMIKLQKLANEAAERYSLDQSTLTIHLLLASDGILKPQREGTAEFEEGMVEYHYQHARRSDNMAKSIANLAVQSNSRDNLSVIVLEDIAPGKGQPIAAAVCDGCLGKGHVIAERCIEAMQKAIAQEVAKSTSTRMVRRYQPRRPDDRSR
jgi:hypothetical protein